MSKSRYKILLIEDDKVDRLAFERLFKDKYPPYNCTIASSVSEASSILNAKSFDIIISDHYLGDGTAFDIFDLVKNTPIIFVTGTGDEELAVKAMKAGACDYIVKDQEKNYLKTVPVVIENALRHKALQEVLDRKKKNLETIFDSVPIGLLLVDENIIVQRVNNAIRQMVNRKYSQIIKRPICSSLGCVNSPCTEKGNRSCPDRKICTLRETVKGVFNSGKSIYEDEINPTHRVNNKEIKSWFSVCATPVTIDDCKLVVVAMNDITDRKKAEEKLKEAMEIKSQFISTVSHELRTPLTCVKNAIANILDGTEGKINERQRSFLDIAKRNIDRLALLVNDVLDFQKLEAGRMKFNMQFNDVSKVVQEVHKIMTLCAEKKGIDFSLELEDNLPKTRFDKDKIYQVLTNLVSNAIKLTPNHGHVSVSVQHQGEELAIRVNDTGMGIPKEALPRIFERFYCIPRPGKQIQGTGLGLAIVKKIVIMHGGRIEVESEIDYGTTVTVFLSLDTNRIPEVSSEEVDKILENAIINN